MSLGQRMQLSLRARVSNASQDNKPTYKIDEFYFLTDPEDHIYQHFPDDPAWQLLRRPITLDDFIRLPILKSPFFNARLALLPPSLNQAPLESVIKVGEGRAELRLLAPRPMGFAAKLRVKEGGASDEALAERSFIRIIKVGVDIGKRFDWSMYF